MNDKTSEITPDLSIEIGPGGISRVLIYASDAAGQSACHQLLARVSSQLFLLDVALKHSARVVEKELQAVKQ